MTTAVIMTTAAFLSSCPGMGKVGGGLLPLSCWSQTLLAHAYITQTHSDSVLVCYNYLSCVIYSQKAPKKLYSHQ